MRLPKKKQRQKNGFWLRFALVLLIFLLLIFAGLKFSQIKKNSLYDSKNNFNLALEDNQNLYLISFHPDPGLLNILQIPGDVYVPMAKGFGEYPVASIWGLGQFEPYGGGTLLRLSSQNFLKVPVQGWAKINSSNKEKVKINKKTVSHWLFLLLQKNSSNLTRWDILRLWWQTNGLSNSQLIVHELDETRASESVQLADGTQAYKVQKEFLQKVAKELFSDPGFSQEGIVWAVLNNSEQNGLAISASEIIHNIGGETIPLFAKNDKPGGIYCDQEKICDSYSTKLLSKTFNLPIRQEKMDESRGEALVVLDQNYWDFFYKR